MDELSPPVYGTVAEFVENYLVQIIDRPLRDGMWCPWWWRHTEAIARFDALWRAWEYRRYQLNGSNSWLLGDLDPHLRTLMDPNLGPFGGCGISACGVDRRVRFPVLSTPIGRVGDRFAVPPDGETFYPDAGRFVAEHLSLLYRLPTDCLTPRCPRWWSHEDVVARVDALWRAWEYLRLQSPAGTSIWMTEHADPLMSRLVAAEGPFRYCETNRHTDESAPLPVTPEEVMFGHLRGEYTNGETAFADVTEFFGGYLARMYTVGETAAWCPEWWRHVEAVLRIDALWRSWERLRRDERAGMIIWFEDADTHMRILTGPTGPLRNCGINSGHRDNGMGLPAEKCPPHLIFDGNSRDTRS